jgi:flavin-dependent dehydrogenase
MIGSEAWVNTGIVRFHSNASQDPSLSDILADFLSIKKGLRPDTRRFEAHPIRWFDPSSLFSSKGMLLVGDAAGVDALWGEGISFALGYGEVAAKAIVRALEHKDFSFNRYKADLLEHEIGQVLQHRLGLAEGLYRSKAGGNNKDLLRSVLLQG